MEVRTILELIQVFTVYTASVFLAPYFVFYAYLKDKNLFEKFTLSMIIGNFYIINIVFLIFLLHIPGKFTLYLVVILPALLTWRQVNRPNIKGSLILIYTSISRLFLGEAKIRTIWNVLSPAPKKWIKRLIHSVFSHAIHHILEWIMLLGFLAFDIWYFGYHNITRYSYGAPDLTVHHYWINEMGDGNIFCNGVYPFGFHNVIYFIHTFFNIDTMSIMRVFNIVQTIYIYLMLYALLRKICKSTFTPILGIFVFTLPDLFNYLAIMRYQSSLPQEFGMLFLYPSAYFLIQFFERKKEEIQTEKELQQKRKLYAWMEQYHILPSTRSLVFFAMSFSMTLAAHFYITIIAVFLCLAVAIAYFPLVFHPRYFFAIALAGILSLASAVAPLGIAFAQGTPLQGSLEWALGIMSGSSEEEEAANEENQEETDAEGTDSEGAENEESDSEGTDNEGTDSKGTDNVTSMKPDNGSLSDGSLSDGSSASGSQPTEEIGTFDKIITKIQEAALKIIKGLLDFNEKSSIFLCNVFHGIEITTSLVLLMEGLMFFSLLAIIIRRTFYYRNLMFVALYLFFLTLVCCAEPFHLPSLMELGRASIFMAYALPLLVACTVDIIYKIINRSQNRIMEIFPIGVTAALTILTITNHFIKPLTMIYATQTSGEVYCNYEIMENYPDKKWTVVTTTNSLQLIKHKGWHMEASTFLAKMEDYMTSLRVTIPTKYVFFYIEKTPIALGYADYVSNPIANTGPISREDAEKYIDFRDTMVYNVPNRQILESRFFYWAKAFEAKYPQEFQVYYEDESFICYRLVQNEYNLYNFAIDYGFNRRE